MKEAVNFEVHGEVVLITLDRPKANAIDAKTSHELGDAFINLKIIIGIAYLAIISAGLFFLLSIVDIRDLMSYEFIRSN